MKLSMPQAGKLDIGYVCVCVAPLVAKDLSVLAEEESRHHAWAPPKVRPDEVGRARWAAKQVLGVVRLGAATRARGGDVWVQAVLVAAQKRRETATQLRESHTRHPRE